MRAAAALHDRRVVRSHVGLAILTGGQTGVDSYAAAAALGLGLPVHLVFPKGYRQEDGPLTEARRAEFGGATMHELSSASFRYRTWTCAYLADAVALFDPAGGTGCGETARAAREIGRPLLRPAAGELKADQAAGWLAETGARVLMVAGCRASLLASHGKVRSVRTDLAVLMEAARRHDRRLASAVTSRPPVN
jgi:hypothetical protein